MPAPVRLTDPELSTASESAARSVPGLWQGDDVTAIQQILERVRAGGGHIVLDGAAMVPLSDLLAARQLRPGEIVNVFAPIAWTIALLHEHGWRHGALDATTIVLDDEGRPLLSDWRRARPVTRGSGPLGMVRRDSRWTRRGGDLEALATVLRASLAETAIPAAGSADELSRRLGRLNNGGRVVSGGNATAARARSIAQALFEWADAEAVDPLPVARSEPTNRPPFPATLLAALAGLLAAVGAGLALWAGVSPPGTTAPAQPQPVEPAAWQLLQQRAGCLQLGDTECLAGLYDSNTAGLELDVQRLATGTATTTPESIRLLDADDRTALLTFALSSGERGTLLVEHDAQNWLLRLVRLDGDA